MPTMLGLDLGEFKSVSCLDRPATQETAYLTIDTDPTLLRRHLEQLRPGLVVDDAGFVAERQGTIGPAAELESNATRVHASKRY